MKDVNVGNYIVRVIEVKNVKLENGVWYSDGWKLYPTDTQDLYLAVKDKRK